MNRISSSLPYNAAHIRPRLLSSTSRQSSRTAIVTGSARGIGKAIALRLARDGYDVAVNDISSAQKHMDETVSEIHSLGRKAYGHVADVSQEEEVKGLVEASVANLGPLHTMIANAGIAQVKPLIDLSTADFERMLRVNVLGVQFCYQTAARQMIEQGTPGKLIGAASIVAFKPFALLGHYSASKWAVRGLTQAWAMEMAEHGITVNAYAPGIVGTGMWDLIDEGLAKKKGAKRGEMIKKYSESIHLGRTSVPEDVSNLVSFMASKDADYVTGQTYVVDGGIVFT
ncbi:NAD(P)-binding protein [Thozetella sp. PMI_491]|nr:NAD(P)-binding protein [Thozetella sp. PMI_491]